MFSKMFKAASEITGGLNSDTMLSDKKKRRTLFVEIHRGKHSYPETDWCIKTECNKENTIGSIKGRCLTVNSCCLSVAHCATIFRFFSYFIQLLRVVDALSLFWQLNCQLSFCPVLDYLRLNFVPCWLLQWYLFYY